jgi:hypothetical protein
MNGMIKNTFPLNRKGVIWGKAFENVLWTAKKSGKESVLFGVFGYYRGDITLLEGIPHGGHLPETLHDFCE